MTSVNINKCQIINYLTEQALGVDPGKLCTVILGNPVDRKPSTKMCNGNTTPAMPWYKVKITTAKAGTLASIDEVFYVGVKQKPNSPDHCLWIVHEVIGGPNNCWNTCDEEDGLSPEVIKALIDELVAAMADTSSGVEHWIENNQKEIVVGIIATVIFALLWEEFGIYEVGKEIVEGVAAVLG